MNGRMAKKIRKISYSGGVYDRKEGKSEFKGRKHITFTDAKGNKVGEKTINLYQVYAGETQQIYKLAKKEYKRDNLSCKQINKQYNALEKAGRRITNEMSSM